jgi:hypothetical protein
MRTRAHLHLTAELDQAASTNNQTEAAPVLACFVTQTIADQIRAFIASLTKADLTYPFYRMTETRRQLQCAQWTKARATRARNEPIRACIDIPACSQTQVDQITNPRVEHSSPSSTPDGSPGHDYCVGNTFVFQYPTDPDNMTTSRNIKSGTVVDRGVTLARLWDFFLTAHTALQGRLPLEYSL